MRCVCILTRIRGVGFCPIRAHVALAISGPSGIFSLTIQGFKDEGTFMANHVSSLKRARQTETRTAVNRANRTRVRSSLRALREAISKGDVKAAQAQFRETVSTLDKSVQKGVLHSNTVSRYKSRLNARIKTLATAKG